MSLSTGWGSWEMISTGIHILTKFCMGCAVVKPYIPLHSNDTWQILLDHPVCISLTAMLHFPSGLHTLHDYYYNAFYNMTHVELTLMK